MKLVTVFTTVLVAITFTGASATIINVPDDYPTIQEGVDASTDGDTVLVQPGTYVENINFNGHNIIVGSLFLMTEDTSHISSTIIDGNQSDHVVAFENWEDSTAIITGFTITNGSSDLGGGIHCWYSNPTVDNNVITGNSALGGGGGGIFCFYSNPTIVNNSITENSALGGGGIRCGYSNPIVVNNIISENVVTGNGGGINCYGSSPVVENNVISQNSAVIGGGLFCHTYSDLTMRNNTIHENSGTITGGGIYCHNSSPVITNTIFWDDSSQNGPEIFIYAGGSPAFSYCDIEGGWEGEGNIDVDPLFRDAENGDFHLMSTECGNPYDSPCIDAGHPDILDSLLDCSWGLGQLRSDMGAYSGGDSVTVGIDYPDFRLPREVSIAQNYPNPFNAMTVIRYALPVEAEVTIKIYDILGRRVTMLQNGLQQAGYHQVIWDASNVSSGIYFYRINAGEYSEAKKLLLLK